MLIIPAIDLLEGKVVRLTEGRKESATVYSDSPGEIARRFVAAGAQRLHVVDLDGAFSGSRENADALARIAAAGAPVQVGGGMRELEQLQRVLDVGASWVVVGTLVARDPDAFLRAPAELLRRVIVAVDARDGRVFVEGWNRATGIDALDLAKKVAPQVAGILYTDIARDGTGRGPNVEATRRMAEALAPAMVIASGGIGGLADLRALRDAGVPACVVGRALYENRFTLPEALLEARS